MNTLTHAATVAREEREHEIAALLLDRTDGRLEDVVEWLMLAVDDVAAQMVAEAEYAGAHLRDQLHHRLRSLYPSLTMEDALEAAATLRAVDTDLVTQESTGVDLAGRLAGHIPAEVGIPAAPSMARFTSTWSDSMIPHQEIAEVQNFEAAQPVAGARPHCKVHGGFARNSDGKCARCDEQVDTPTDVQKLLDALAAHFQAEKVEPVAKVEPVVQAVAKNASLRFAVRSSGVITRRSLYAMAKITTDPVVEIPTSRDGFAAYAKTHGIVLEEVPVSAL